MISHVKTRKYPSQARRNERRIFVRTGPDMRNATDTGKTARTGGEYPALRKGQMVNMSAPERAANVAGTLDERR